MSFRFYDDEISTCICLPNTNKLQFRLTSMGKFILYTIFIIYFMKSTFQNFFQECIYSVFCMICAYANHSFNYKWNLIVILSIFKAISNYFTLCTKEIFSFLYDIKTFSTKAKRWRAAKRLPCFEQPIRNDRFCNLSSKIIEFSHDSSKLTIVKMALL